MDGPTTHQRRGDLDALRAFAMLLGIVLHASTSFYGSVWPVHDSRQSAAMPLLFVTIHGFRMPMFFLLSGFFTMLVFRRRGLQALLRERVRRVALPLGLAMVSILPLCQWLGERGIATETREPMVAAVVSDDVAAVRALLDAGTGVEARDAVFHRPWLSWAAMADAGGVAEVLLAAGADPNVDRSVGSTPLHLAAFCGGAAVAERLLAAGADPRARTLGGTVPRESLALSPTHVAAYVRMNGLPEADAARIAAGRPRTRRLIEEAGGDDGAGPTSTVERIAERYWLSIASDRFLVAPRDPRSLHLVQTNVFEHLWFLWYLCWLVAAFALVVWAGFAPTGRFRWWLVPSSCLFQVFMDPPHGQLYGPDIAFGILPPPHLLGYYGCFFFFGAAVFAAEGTGTSLGRRWPVLLPLGLLACFPAGIALLGDRTASILLQPAYAWAMALGLIGLFHRYAPVPGATIAWLADASYWMYLAHLPLVIALQTGARDWPITAPVKFALVFATTTAILLVSYHRWIRPTFVGRMLGGSLPIRRAAGTRGKP